MNQPATPNSLIEGFPALPERDGDWAGDDWYTADTMQAYAEAYVLADRAQRPSSLAPTVAGSVDTPELEVLLQEWRQCYGRPGQKSTRAALIDYINARLAPAAPSGEAVALVPKWEGEFKNFQQWVNKAQSWLTSPSYRPAVCIDAKGRRCTSGADMQRARDEDAFPVRFFWECHPAPSSPTAPGQQAQAVPEGWREALIDMEHRLNKARIWGGMGWHYNALAPLHYKPVLDKINLLLTAQASASTPEGK